MALDGDEVWQVHVGGTGSRQRTRQEWGGFPGAKLGKALGVRRGISASDFRSKMILWLRVEDGPRAEGGSKAKRQEAVGVTLGLLVGEQTKQWRKEDTGLDPG